VSVPFSNLCFAAGIAESEVCSGQPRSRKVKVLRDIEGGELQRLMATH
jgi:hypothetical protein